MITQFFTVYQCTASNSRFLMLTETELLLLFPKYFYSHNQPVRSIQSSLNPEPLSWSAETLGFDWCPADDHIPLPPPLHIRHKGIPSLPIIVQRSLWFNSWNSFSLQQRSLSGLNWHASVDNRHLSLSSTPSRPRGSFCSVDYWADNYRFPLHCLGLRSRKSGARFEPQYKQAVKVRNTQCVSVSSAITAQKIRAGKLSRMWF